MFSTDERLGWRAIFTKFNSAENLPRTNLICTCHCFALPSPPSLPTPLPTSLPPFANVFAIAFSNAAMGVRASSTDFADQGIEHTVKSNQSVESMMRTYWSSRGSADPLSSELLEYAFIHPVCVVRSVALRVFEANWQEGHPLYAPRAARFRFGFGPDDIHTVFEVKAVKRVATVQHWALPGPVVASWMAVELIGRTQTQPSDNLYYTCLSYVGASCAPRFTGPRPDVDPCLGRCADAAFV